MDQDASEESIWINPDELPVLRVLCPAYHAIGKSLVFSSFFKDRGHTVTELDKDISVQLNVKVNL